MSKQLTLAFLATCLVATSAVQFADRSSGRNLVADVVWNSGRNLVADVIWHVTRSESVANAYA